MTLSKKNADNEKKYQRLLLKSNEIVLIGAQIKMHAHNNVSHYLVKKFLSLARSFNMEKLLTTTACTTEKVKAGAHAQRPTLGLGNFFL